MIHLCVQMLDFSAWLAGRASERDFVVLSLSLGEGRDFAVLEKLLADGTLPLVDKVYVHWRYQLTVSRHNKCCVQMKFQVLHHHRPCNGALLGVPAAHCCCGRAAGLHGGAPEWRHMLMQRMCGRQTSCTQLQVVHELDLPCQQPAHHKPRASVLPAALETCQP